VISVRTKSGRVQSSDHSDSEGCQLRFLSCMVFLWQWHVRVGLLNLGLVYSSNQCYVLSTGVQ
jgi:hypothetical protein